MSDAAQPTAAEVRTAAEAVKVALDRHLAAVERRSGEDDPAVYEAFNELAAAAEEYDELLYDRYDEVTPFEIPGAEEALPPYTGPQEPAALSVLLRRDYAVAEPQRLQAQAGRIEAFEDDGAEDGSEEPAADTVHGALAILFGEYDPDEIAARHREFGLEEGDSTLWVTAADDLPEPGSWLDAPFDEADPERVVCRFDVSAAFDDAEDAQDAEDLEDDDLDEDEIEEEGLDDPDDLDDDPDDVEDAFDEGDDREDPYRSTRTPEADTSGGTHRTDGPGNGTAHRGGAGDAGGPDGSGTSPGAVGFDGRDAAGHAATGIVADDDLERL